MASTPRPFGDNSFKGNGILRCNACGEPIRDHRVGHPCPELGEQIFYVERPGYRQHGDNPEAQKQRAYRRKRRAMERESK